MQEYNHEEPQFFIPQFEDWDQLLEVVGEDNSATHWEERSFWVGTSATTRARLALPHGNQAFRGHTNAHFWTYASSSYVHPNYGFRPAVKPLASDPVKFGSEFSRHALYLDGVEQDVRDDNSTPVFVSGQRIEFKKATRPESIITWLYNGRCFIADRVLLRGVSFYELENQGFLEASI